MSLPRHVSVMLGSLLMILWLPSSAASQFEPEGRLFVPGADEDGGDLDEDLVGDWSLEGDVVRLQHEADTFLRDIDFFYRDGRLEGVETFQVTISVVLAKR
jgi:hypothetical protein